MVKISVIVATLVRPSLQNLVATLRNQDLPHAEWELLTWSGCINEYDARNQAAKVAKGEILGFVDDDCLVPTDWLKSALKHFEDPKIQILTGPVQGDVWGHGQQIVIDNRAWFMGCNIFIRKSAFDAVGGFEATWGLDPPPKGWRGDTDIGWRILDRFGDSSYLHVKDVMVLHNGRMQSAFQPGVEAKFYLRHRARCLEYFAPIDPRMDSFVLNNGIETDPPTVEYLRWLLDRFFRRARPEIGFYYACPHCKEDFRNLADFRKHLVDVHKADPKVIEDNGIKWWVPPDAFNYVPLEDHEKNILRWVEKLLGPDRKGTLIDVGAERGLYAISLAKYFERVVALEPAAEYAASMKETIKLNGLDYVDVQTKAAYDHEGWLYLGKFGVNQRAEYSVREELERAGDTTYTVEGITLDSLDVKDCRLLKVDVEGAGHLVFKGAEKLLSDMGPWSMVLFEAHFLTTDEEGVEGDKILEAHGFKKMATWWQHGAVHELWQKPLITNA